MLNESRAQRPLGNPTLPGNSEHLGQLRGNFAFLRGFMRHPAQVGSVVPSSKRLRDLLVRQAHLAQARTVVELGPGTGGTTASFLNALHPAAHLLAIELDADFHAHLSQSLSDPRLALELGSAERLEEFLASRRLHAPDAIISGIPFSTMPAEVSDRVAQAVSRALKPGGRFVAYQVRAHVADFVSPYLGEADRRWEPVNVPPVRVFTWIKPV
ncbi:MAG: methyltransferase domain-containing protein [Pseudomonadota bacterium]